MILKTTFPSKNHPKEKPNAAEATAAMTVLTTLIAESWLTTFFSLLIFII